MGFEASGFGFRVSGFGFRVSGLGFRGWARLELHALVDQARGQLLPLGVFLLQPSLVIGSVQEVGIHPENQRWAEGQLLPLGVLLM